MAEDYQQMKMQILLVALVIACVSATPIQTTSDNHPLSDSESQGKQIEKISIQGQSEQKKTLESVKGDKNEVKLTDGKIEIVIEETFSPDKELIAPEPEIIPQNEVYLEDIPDTPFVDSNLYRNPLENKVQDEIMETAEGFIPVPIIRKRHHARRRFSIAKTNRRYFRKNPYYTPYYLYPYYSFYRPSSLRYY